MHRVLQYRSESRYERCVLDIFVSEKRAAIATMQRQPQHAIDLLTACIDKYATRKHTNTQLMPTLTFAESHGLLGNDHYMHEDSSIRRAHIAAYVVHMCTCTYVKYTMSCRHVLM